MRETIETTCYDAMQLKDTMSNYYTDSKVLSGGFVG